MTTLILPSVLKELHIDETNIDRFRGFLINESKFETQMYPDGTLQVAGSVNSYQNRDAIAAALKKTVNILSKKQILPANMGCVGFSSLFSSDEKIIVWYLHSNSKSSDAETVTISPNEFWDDKSLPPLDLIPVHIVFRKNMNKQTCTNFFHIVEKYYSSVCVQGILGEGPIRLKNREIAFYTKLAHFTLDAGMSGQHTLNWLIIHLLHFSETVQITDIFFTNYPKKTIHIPSDWSNLGEAYDNSTPQGQVLFRRPAVSFTQPSFEKMYGLANQKRISLYIDNLPSDTENTDKNEHNAGTENTEYVFSNIFCGNVKFYKTLSSEKYPILSMPGISQENLWINILFEPLCSNESQFLISMFSGWKNIGLGGGFGGFFRFASEPYYDESGNILSMLCDIGDADDNMAFTVLINLLNALDISGITVSELLFSNTNMSCCPCPEPLSSVPKPQTWD